MSKKVAIGAGHGINTPGKRTPDGEREWSFNNKVVLAAIEELKKYDVEILRLDDPTGRTDVSLQARTSKANSWGADILVSCHKNAFRGIWGSHGGTEVLIWNGNYSGKASTKRLASIILDEQVKAYGLRNRGVKEANLHMLRESNMTAVLVEGAFMDSTTDIVKLRSDAVLKKAGVGIANGIVTYLGLKPKVVVPPKPAPVPENLYRIRKSWADDKSQIGAYSNLDSAIMVSKRVSGYKVYDESGEQVYPIILPNEPPLTQDELRKVRALIK